MWGDITETFIWPGLEFPILTSDLKAFNTVNFWGQNYPSDLHQETEVCWNEDMDSQWGFFSQSLTWLWTLLSLGVCVCVVTNDMTERLWWFFPVYFRQTPPDQISFFLSFSLSSYQKRSLQMVRSLHLV